MSEMKRAPVMDRHSVSNIFVFFLIGLFAVLAVMLTLISVRAYRSVSQASVNNSEGQIALSYLINKVRSSDVEKGVSLKTLEGVTVLCLEEAWEGDTYETRIFFKDGTVQEYFCDQQDAFDPEDGEPIASLNALSMTMEQPWLLAVEAVQPDGRKQSLHIALRTGEAQP